MNDYSDILFLMASMLMLSMVTANTIRTYSTSNQSLVRSELEYRMMAAAQDEIDAARWVDSPNELNSAHASYKFANYPIVRTITFGSTSQYSDQATIAASATLVEDNASVARYEIIVTATSTYLSPSVNATLNYIKTFKK